MFVYYFLSLYWCFCTLYVLFLLITFYLKLSPIASFSQLSQYGKTLSKDEGKGWYMLPKCWFLYFYVIAVIVNISIWFYIIIGNTIEFKSYSKPPYMPPNTALYMLFLSTIQTCRRLYECLFVSRFSKHAVMHVAFALLGGTYYSCIALTILASSEEIGLHMIPLNFFYSPNVILATALFAYTSYHQFICHKILADLRDPKSRTGSSRYSIPQGDWFNFLSAPHYIADLLVYLSYIILSNGACPLIWGLAMYTGSAMFYLAVTTHYWYREAFKDYPKNRKSFIPFVF